MAIASVCQRRQPREASANNREDGLPRDAMEGIGQVDEDKHPVRVVAESVGPLPGSRYEPCLNFVKIRTFSFKECAKTNGHTRELPASRDLDTDREFGKTASSILMKYKVQTSHNRAHENFSPKKFHPAKKR